MQSASKGEEFSLSKFCRRERIFLWSFFFLSKCPGKKRRRYECYVLLSVLPFLLCLHLCEQFLIYCRTSILSSVLSKCLMGHGAPPLVVAS